MTVEVTFHPDVPLGETPQEPPRPAPSRPG